MSPLTGKRRGVLWAASLLMSVLALSATLPALAAARTAPLGHLRVPVTRTRWDWGGWYHQGSYGATTLTLAPTTAAALQSLGVAAAPVAPATANPDGSLSFPITDSLFVAAYTRTITHSGGISLSAGSTTVDLTNFDISLSGAPTLSADVGGSRVTILNLSLAGASVHVCGGQLQIGPVTATLTPAAASALDGAFHVSAFTPGLELGTAVIDYNLFF
ncbi:MAG TPA: hypothetical protein VMF07_17020 [Solirubrobacteraceae bacterium]|nr:hypothetical protein [Solirubrobacteraceae bacterium]